MDSFQWSLRAPCKLYFQHHELLQLAALSPGNQRKNWNLEVRSPEITGPRLRADQRDVTGQGQVWPKNAVANETKVVRKTRGACLFYSYETKAEILETWEILIRKHILWG